MVACWRGAVSENGAAAQVPSGCFADGIGAAEGGRWRSAARRHGAAFLPAAVQDVISVRQDASVGIGTLIQR